MLGSALNVLHLYSYQESDCNVIFEFDADDKFNMFRQLTPELRATENVKINGYCWQYAITKTNFSSLIL